MAYDELMKQLGESLELDGFASDEKGRYRLSVDGSVVTFIARNQGRVLDTVAKICDLPDAGGDPICRSLLSAMAPDGGAETYGFFLAPDGKSVGLRRTDALDALDLDACRQMLEDFANALEEWRRAIEAFHQALPALHEAVAHETDESRPFGLDGTGFMQV